MLTRNKWLPQGNNDSSKKYDKVIASQYLLVNNDFPNTITVTFEHYSVIQFRIKNL